MTQSNSLRIDLFCAVIDNFGDVAVCWRLARQLATEQGCAVRLWVDRPEVLTQLQQGEWVDGVCIGDWQEAAQTQPAALVIEAFACNPPDAFVASMARCNPSPVWLNLEYLSAEAWVEGCHLLPSKHPQRGLNKYFYFPGFSAKTGGLLKEAALDAQREAFDAATFWQACGVSAPQVGALCVSLFAYENAALPLLLDVWAAGDQPVFCAVPVGRPLPAIEVWSGKSLQAGNLVERGNLKLVVLPFLTQLKYDQLLWACDLNFVRGEDSFVRAQWAQRPFVWHIYQQDENAHLVKLDAFLTAFAAGLSVPAHQALWAFWHAWEAQDGAAACWPDMCRHLPELRQHSATWANRVAEHGDLCSNMLFFCKGLLE